MTFSKSISLAILQNKGYKIALTHSDVCTVEGGHNMENTSWITLSFYRYVKIKDPEALKLQLFSKWSDWNILGRIYVSQEGINAQLSLPQEHYQSWYSDLCEIFPSMPLKVAIDDHAKPSFRKLKIKTRTKIVADGLNDETFDSSDVGRHLTAAEFNEAMDSGEAIVVDMRNHYECEVGHFENAYLPEASSFREALPEVKEHLEDKKEKKILLYCTGGIRCEKASAWLRHQGFSDVNQLHGGIIDYYRQVKRQGLESKFKGVNFVFDDRLGERVTDDVLSECHQCGTKWDQHTNCKNPGCNRLFLQCDDCIEADDRCCSEECQKVMQGTREEQIRWQNEQEKIAPKFHRSRKRLKPLETLVPDNIAESRIH